jgi:hypothetical protein
MLGPKLHECVIDGGKWGFKSKIYIKVYDKNSFDEFLFSN